MKWEWIAIPVLVAVGVAALLMSRSSSPGSKPSEQDGAPYSGGHPEAPPKAPSRRTSVPLSAPAPVAPSPAPAVRRPGPDDRALSWLAGAQGADGRWKGKLRITGLSLYAFLCCGETHKHGRFKKTVRNGLKLLKQAQGPDGAFAPLGHSDNLPDHVIATLAMCEAYALTLSPLFKGSAQLGLDATARLLDEVECQKAYGISSAAVGPASWIWLALAYRCARDAGLQVSDASLAGCRDRVIAAYGSPRFLPASAAALQAGRLFAGMLLDCEPEKHPEMMATLSRLRSGPSGAEQSDSAYWLFGLSAVFVTNDPETWEIWCRAFDRDVLSRQREDGSWGAEGTQSWGLGEAGNTAIYLTGLALREAYPRSFKTTK